MLKSLTVIAALFCAAPAFAQDGEFTTTNDVVNAMMTDWAEYDAACRGTSPSQGADGFCGARDYIGWSLNQSGVCLAEDVQTGAQVWEICKEESYMFEDPIADIRADL